MTPERLKEIQQHLTVRGEWYGSAVERELLAEVEAQAEEVERLRRLLMDCRRAFHRVKEKTLFDRYDRWETNGKMDEMVERILVALSPSPESRWTAKGAERLARFGDLDRLDDLVHGRITYEQFQRGSSPSPEPTPRQKAEAWVLADDASPGMLAGPAEPTPLEPLKDTQKDSATSCPLREPQSLSPPCTVEGSSKLPTNSGAEPALTVEQVQGSWDRLRERFRAETGEPLPAVQYVRCDSCEAILPREEIALDSASGINLCKGKHIGPPAEPAPRETEPRRFTEAEVGRALGYVSVDIPELHSVHPERLLASFRRALDGEGET